MEEHDPLDISAYEMRQNREPIEVVEGEVITGERATPLSERPFEAVSKYLTARAALKESKKEAFLEALARSGNITMACAVAGWSRSMPAYYRGADPAFEEAMMEALEISTDALEAQARHLALNGVDEPILHNGVVVAYRTKYSEAMLTLLLKAKRRSEFGDKLEATHDVKGGVLVVPGMASTDDWEKRAVAQQAEYRGETGATET